MAKHRKAIVGVVLVVLCVVAGIAVSGLSAPVVGTSEGLTDMHLVHSELRPSDRAPSEMAQTGRIIISFLAPGRHQTSGWLRAFWLSRPVSAGQVLTYEPSEQDYQDPTSLPAKFGVGRHLPVTFFVEDGLVVHRMTGFSLEWWTDSAVLVEDFLGGKAFEPTILETNLEIGLPLGQFRALGRDGAWEDLPPHEQVCLIYVTSPLCSVCEETSGWARDFARQASGAVWYSLILDISGDGGLASAAGALGLEEVAAASPGYSLDRLVTADEAWTYADSLQLPGRIVLDTEGWAKRTLNIGGLPAVLLVDGHGRLVAKHSIGVLGEGRASRGSFNDLLLEEVERISGP